MLAGGDCLFFYSWQILAAIRSSIDDILLFFLRSLYTVFFDWSQLDGGALQIIINGMRDSRVLHFLYAGRYLTSFKGPDQRDFNSVFWHVLIGLAWIWTASNCKIFQKPPQFYNKQGILCGVQQKPFRKNNIFWEIFLNCRNLFRNIFLTQ